MNPLDFDGITRGVADYVPKPSVVALRYPELPRWHRRETSFVARSDVCLEVLMAHLHSQCDADCMPRAASNAGLEGVIYAPGSKFSFEINLFSDVERGMAETVVEFARMSGCSIEFNSFFSAMKTLFSESDSSSSSRPFVGSAPTFGAAPAFAAPALSFEGSLMSDADGPAAAQATADLLRDACAIAGSAAPATASEGLLMIASAAADAAHAPAVAACLAADADLAGTLAQTLTSALAPASAADTRVAAAVAVANLAQDVNGLAWVAHAELVDAVQRAAADADEGSAAPLAPLQKRELYRQVARCVARAIATSASEARTQVSQEHLDRLAAHFRAQQTLCKRDQEAADELERSVSAFGAQQ